MGILGHLLKEIAEAERQYLEGGKQYYDWLTLESLMTLATVKVRAMKEDVTKSIEENVIGQ